MSVGVPGAYRHMSTSGRYSPELVAVLLPVAWGHAPWVTREPPVGRCRRGTGQCTHDCEADQWGEDCVVDGDHKTCRHRHGGHDQCGRCVCVDPSNRGATSVRDSDMHVMAMDIERAWRDTFAYGHSVIARALYLRHYYGLTQTEIALIQGVGQQAVSLRLRAGHLALADYLNGESFE